MSRRIRTQQQSVDLLTAEREKQQEEQIAWFLQGMYYAGKLPSRAESREIAHYLRRHWVALGTPQEIEVQVLEAMKVLHGENG